ncbi:unnamed protein product [Oikopleura dioica]|uniref:Uncharacterized protein n=1 Tax=Oikopleura dioica TaxID=34765 RepID=E4WVS2_OIKDI|nr:unnamed protein product [Oikopleura dioica]
MEARLREINAQVEKMIVLLGGEISQEQQSEVVQEYKDDPMPQEEPEEHPALPKACLPHVPEEPEPVACEEGEVEIAVCSVTTNEEPKAVVDDYETTEEMFNKSAEAGLAVRQ